VRDVLSGSAAKVIEISCRFYPIQVGSCMCRMHVTPANSLYLAAILFQRSWLFLFMKRVYHATKPGISKSCKIHIWIMLLLLLLGKTLKGIVYLG
jgi:hypothetical protein